MDFQKNKKQILLAGGTVIIVLILLCLPSFLGTDKAAEQSVDLDTESYWQDIQDADKDPLAADKNELLPFPEKEEEFQNTYPSPSFVTSNEDTLIYKNGIYVRIGYAPEKPVIDTIEVDGVQYVRVTQP